MFIPRFFPAPLAPEIFDRRPGQVGLDLQIAVPRQLFKMAPVYRQVDCFRIEYADVLSAVFADRDPAFGIVG